MYLLIKQVLIRSQYPSSRPCRRQRNTSQDHSCQGRSSRFQACRSHKSPEGRLLLHWRRSQKRQAYDSKSTQYPSPRAMPPNRPLPSSLLSSSVSPNRRRHNILPRRNQAHSPHCPPHSSHYFSTARARTQPRHSGSREALRLRRPSRTLRLHQRVWPRPQEAPPNASSRPH